MSKFTQVLLFLCVRIFVGLLLEPFELLCTEVSYMSLVPIFLIICGLLTWFEMFLTPVEIK